MGYKKESLEKLIFLIEEICNDEQNHWFKEALFKRIVLGEELLSGNSNPEFGAYFKLLKKQFRLKASKLYAEIKDIKLKNDLIGDCIKMYWFQVNNDVDQLFLHAFYQMENLLNYYAHKSNAFEKIKTNKDFYSHYFSETFTVSGYSNFFNSDNTPKDLDKVHIWGKIVFWAYDSNRVEYLKSNNPQFYQLIKIRNRNSHRNSTSIKSDEYSTEIIRVSDYSAFGFYMNILKEILKSVADINTSIEKKSFEATKVVLPGPKIIGKIDL